MYSIIIYCGLGILLIGSIFGFYVAYKGLRDSNGGLARSIKLNVFTQGPPSPYMRKLIKIWLAIMLIGFIITGIGISIGLH